MFRKLVIISLFLGVYFFGWITSQYKLFPYEQVKGLKYKLLSMNDMHSDFMDISNKVEVDCNTLKEGNNSLVIFTFGQSNSANWGGYNSKYEVQHNVVNLYDGQCYKADDPMLGATGDSGSIWGRLGDRIIEKTHYDTVLFKTIGIGATSVKQWDGEYRERVAQSIQEVQEMGFSIDLVMWHQGESDYKSMEKETYKEHFKNIKKIFTHKRVNTPFSIAIATYSYGFFDENIAQAQRELIEEDDNIYEGVNTDKIVGYRDGVHFNRQGLDKVADEWFEALVRERLLK